MLVSLSEPPRRFALMAVDRASASWLLRRERFGRVAMPRALLVDDDSSSLAPLAHLIQLDGFTTVTAMTLSQAQTLLDEGVFEVVLTDLILPDGSGLELMETAAAMGAQVVLITGHASVETAIQALRQGATDYL